MRVVAEQESWLPVVCKDAKELRQCVFRETIPLALVDLPSRSSEAYDGYRKIAEWLSELGTWNGTSGVLLVVCAAGESVQEEIWARQLGTWSYLPLVQVPTQEQMAMRQPREGLSLLFGEARELLAKSSKGTTKSIMEWNQSKYDH
jgi:hypothetical protein